MVRSFNFFGEGLGGSRGSSGRIKHERGTLGSMRKTSENKAGNGSPCFGGRLSAEGTFRALFMGMKGNGTSPQIPGHKSQ